MAGWIAEMLFMLSLLILLCNGQNIAEYEVYWLMGFPIINLWGARFTSTFSVYFLLWLVDCKVLFFAYTAV